MNLKLTFIGLALMAGFAAAAQETNPVAQTGYAAFRIISERNIFDQYRVAGRHETGWRAATTTEWLGDAFSLVGTMSYAKGDFAFFKGTNSEYRRVVRPEGAIAGYKVTEITPQSVKLESGGQTVEMKVGTEMRRNDDGGWQLVAASELPAAADGRAVASPTEQARSSSDGQASDVLEKLRQQREQELK